MRFKTPIYYLPPIIWAIVILILSILPSDNMPKLWEDFFIQPDKLAHFLFYSTLSFLVTYTIKKTQALTKLSASKMLQVFLIVFLYGVFLELLQFIIFVSRNGDIFDIFANFLGTLFGVSFYLLIHRKIKFL